MEQERELKIKKRTGAQPADADCVCQIFKDVFGFAISPGTYSNVDEKLFLQLESFESSLKAYLLAARVLQYIRMVKLKQKI